MSATVGDGVPDSDQPRALAALLASSGVLPARNAFRESPVLLPLRQGVSTLRLLDRADRG